MEKQMLGKRFGRLVIIKEYPPDKLTPDFMKGKQ